MKTKHIITFSTLIVFFSPLLLAFAKRFGGARWRPARHLWFILLTAGGVAGGEAFAQQTPPPDKQNITVTTQDAFYPKGDQALFTYVMYNVKYSEEARKKYIEGNVSLSFDVMPDSSVANVKIISDQPFGVGEAVKALVEKLKFAPAMQMGMKVKMNLMMDFPVKAH